MFGVPKLDKRLKNKDEVLTLLLRPKGAAPDAERRCCTSLLIPLGLSGVMQQECSSEMGKEDIT